MSHILKSTLSTLSILVLSASAAHADGEFKRWAVSAGWLHVMPQGKANSTHINTAVEEGGNYGVSELKTADVINHSTNLDDYRKGIAGIAVGTIENDYKKDPNSLVANTFTKDLYANTSGITNWSNEAGLEADNVDTLGLTLSYFLNDKVSVEVVGGIPPKVDIKGKGQIVASVHAVSESEGLIPKFVDGLTLEKDILITDLGAHGNVAEVTAWTPVVTAKYHFGQSGVNKFRPFVGAGLAYGYFNKLKLNKGLEQDMINAGHMIQNVLDDKSGIALQNSGSSSANPVVKVKTDDAFAPALTAGFSHDLTDRWFTTASLTYIPNFNNTATITVADENTGKQLIEAKTKVDLDPLITYLGVGYRF